MKISLNVVSFFACSTEQGPADPKGPIDIFGQRFPFQSKEETQYLAGAYGIGQSLWYWPEPVVLAGACGIGRSLWGPGPRSGDPSKDMKGHARTKRALAGMSPPARSVARPEGFWVTHNLHVPTLTRSRVLPGDPQRGEGLW